MGKVESLEDFVGESFLTSDERSFLAQIRKSKKEV